MVNAVKKSQRLLNVMFQNRFNPAIIQLREAWLAGRFGNLVTATIRLRWCRYQDYYEDGWHGTWAMDGGVINQQAIHHLDVLDWICGPIESVCAAEGNLANILEAEDTLVACVKFKNGALGTIEATTAARPKDYEASLSVVGDKGTVVIGGIALNKVEIWDFVSPSREDATVKIACSQEVPSGYGLSHGPLLEEIAARICSESGVLPIPAEEGMRTVSLVHALYASIEKGGWVSLCNKPMSVRLGVSL